MTDLSKLELRVLSRLSPTLATAAEAGRDLATVRAAELFGVAEDLVTAEQRRYAKTILHGELYGMPALRKAPPL